MNLIAVTVCLVRKKKEAPFQPSKGVASRQTNWINSPLHVKKAISTPAPLKGVSRI